MTNSLGWTYKNQITAVFFCLLFAFVVNLWAVELIPTPQSMKLTGGKRPWVAPKTSIDHSLPREGYQLTITADGVKLVGGSEAGLFYGRNTMEQLAAPEGKWLPCLKIEDAPKYEIRGFMHDTGRNFQTIESLKKQLAIFAKYRLNVFHWHLTDNPAWRVESKIYPQLNDPKFRKKGRDENATYSFQQIRDLIQYARKLHIQIIPELDMPGHSEYFKKTFGFKMGTPEGIEVLKKLLTEFCREIPASDCPIIHIGSDEVRIPDPQGFIRSIENHLASLGREVMIWAPGLHPVRTSTIVQFWKTKSIGSRAYAKQKVVLDSSHGYLNYYDPQQIVKRHATMPLVDGAKGSILCCWPDSRVVDKRKIFSQNGVWTGLLAFSEVTWAGPVSDFGAFEQRMMTHRDVYFRDLPFDYIPQERHSWKLVNSNTRLQGSAFLLQEPGPKKLLDIKVGTVAELRSFVTVPKDGVYRFRVGFEAPVRSNHLSTGMPKQGELDASGGTVTIGGITLTPPTYRFPGQFRVPYPTWGRWENECPFEDEQFWWLREPASIRLKAGRHEVVFKAPYQMKNASWTPVLLPVRFDGKRWVDNEAITFQAE